MSKKENSVNKFLNEEDVEKISTIYLNYSNLDTFNSIQRNFNNIEFLSLQNNNISNFDFIKFLPNLFYFDIRNNPISNYNPLSIKNTFGFLGLQVDKYLEKSLLQIKRLMVGILFVDLDENYKKYFLINNPNILIYNDELVLDFEKIPKKEFLASSSNELKKSLSNYKY